jgi:DNA polymerase-3 subunit alpha
MFLIFDTETTGLPKNWKAPLSDSDNWPRLVQLAWQLHDDSGKLLNAENFIIKPEGYTIPYNASKIHGITTDRANAEGHDLNKVLAIFEKELQNCTYVVGHNIGFDVNIVGAECHRKNTPLTICSELQLDTKDLSIDFCALPGGRGGKFKWPTLTELHKKLFGVAFVDAHDAAYDVDATAKCFFGLISHRVLQLKEITDASSVVYEAPLLDIANFAIEEKEQKEAGISNIEKQKGLDVLLDIPFSHLHSHSQFSILQATTNVQTLVAQAIKHKSPAIAMTDHGNMMGAFHFVREALKNDIKPIVGCEISVCVDRLNKSVKDDGYQVVLLAKNKEGYHNLAKLASSAYTEGFYYIPRIDKTILENHKTGLMVLTGGLWGEIPFKILNEGEQQAEDSFVWYKTMFGDDFYVEINRHGLEEEAVVNEVLLRFAKKYEVKIVATNNTYYTAQENAQAHDILLCVKDGETYTKPKKYIGKKGREFRYGFPNEEFYIKSPEEMKVLFADLPEAIINTNEVVDKVELYKLERDVLLPKFDIPAEFLDVADEADGGKRGENNFLKHLTYVGAEKRYGEITEEIKERLDFELATIERTGYPGYFLIVQDFTTKARELDVSVGPGRGSAAGSAVAYCVGITNVDPIAYNLLFERFLNPDRVSLPDIDIDFDDEGRQKVIDYVIDKYGSKQVAQIITYGTMAAKSSIRDTARVLELPLSDADRIAKLIPDISLGKLFGLSEDELSLKLKNNQDDIINAKLLKSMSNGNDLTAETIKLARVLEGSVRNTGIHACGVIITPDDITNFVPVATAKDSNMYCTQFDNSVVEDAGLLKMDFLGLKTLTLIKDAVKNVKERHGVDLVPDNFPLDDTLTYELFQRGDTIGIFQYESPGMQKHLRSLKPTVFADLIAMNALYRPGPIEYIPSFIKRKNGEEEIVYDLDACAEYLEETYGITVYQEQVMLLSQSLAGFTKGEADVLRKAMGKKILSLLEKLKPKFIEGGKERGHDSKKLEKIWKDWEAFASYAFNKSHSTCYAWIAFQTAYLKAHYPAEYMASVLSNNMNDIKTVTFFMEECKRMGSPVLGPHVNESNYKFTVNAKGEIRFGMGAIKGVGEAAVAAIVKERNQKGIYHSIFDVAKRVDLRAVNKRTFENLALGGAYDGFSNEHRALYFSKLEGDKSFMEHAIKFGNAYQTAADAPPDLFGDAVEAQILEPKLPIVPEWEMLYQLAKEKEVIGLYLSGHPLDDFKFEISHFCNICVGDLKNLAPLIDREVSFAGIITSVQERNDKRGNPFGIFSIEDFTDTKEFLVFKEDWNKIKLFMSSGSFVYIKGKVQKRKWGDELELKFNKVEWLSDVMENAAKLITIKLQLNELTEMRMHDITSLLEEEPEGKCKLEFMVEDKELNYQVKLPSKSVKLSIQKQFLERINMMDGLAYKISS